MKKQLRNIAFVVGLGMAPLSLSPVLMHAQQVNEDQRAYDTGYQRGVNDARQNRQMNMNTDDWHGDRLNAYQQGYQQGYSSAAGYQGAPPAAAPQGDRDTDRAYQSGYQRGIRDAERNRPMDPRTDDWRGERLEAFRQGYEQGYRSVAPERRHHDDDDRH